MSTRFKTAAVMLSILFAMMSCSAEAELGKERVRDFSIVEKMFAEPGNEFRPVPLWVWNEKITCGDIDRMLTYFSETGYGGAFVHPRPGMITEYLSDEWFDLWRYSVERGKELGLDIWIYDEDSYPSGFAGGHVQREMPQSWDHTTLLGFRQTDHITEKTKDSCTFIIRWDGEKMVDITAEVGEAKDPEGPFYLITEMRSPSAAQMAGMPYVDLIYPGVTEKFIDITMSGYEEEFGDELGTTIKGIFTDEPSQQDWSSEMTDAFRQDWGYDLTPNIPCLFTEVGDWKQVRFQVRYTMLRLFIERWAGPWSRYCREHGLIWTGHYWEHKWPRLLLGIDNMAMYQYHRMPGIDMLFNGFNEHSPYENWGNIRSVKELRSAANQMGWTRTLSESYGGGGWDMTFADFKRLTDWEYALGVNFLTQHYAPVTIEGARKFDFPDFFNEYSPWAEDYKTLNDYVARLSLVLSQGDQNCDILVLEPTTTAWMYWGQEYLQPKIDEIGYSFTELLTSLEHSQVEYDLGSETIISGHGRVENGRFIIGERGYSTVIIPEMTEVLLPQTAALLEEFAHQGGRVIALAQPVLVNASPDEQLASLWKEGLTNISSSLDNSLAGNEHIRFERIAGGNLYHHRRDYEDGQLLFLANADTAEYVHGTVVMKGAGLEELDLMTGQVHLYPCESDGTGQVRFGFEIPPAGSLLLFAPDRSSALNGMTPEIEYSSGLDTVAPASPLTVSRLSENILPLDWCSVTVDGENLGENYVWNSCRQLYARFGMKNPWEIPNIQYKQEAVEADTIGTGDIYVKYKFRISGEFDRSSLKLVCERPWLWEVSVNGATVSPVDGEHPLDARSGAYAIGQTVKEGENEVILHIRRMSVYAEIAHAFIMGDFSVIPDADGWIISAPQSPATGSWLSQGMPFYCWSVSYSQDYDIQETDRRYVLKMGKWEGSVCEVWINAKKYGVVAYEPYEFDLTGYLEKGLNKVEVRCVGTLVNLYGPHFSPRESLVKPAFWYMSGNERHLPSDYVLDSYGLQEPFVISAAFPTLQSPSYR